jgi:peptidylprolyl isomerase
VVQGFVIQGGDPTGRGNGGPGYETKDEPNERSNTRGTISMAKTPGADEFGSQFFINLADNTGLDHDNGMPDKFYPFGEVVEGMDVVDAIAESQVDDQDRPEPPIVIETITIVER